MNCSECKNKKVEESLAAEMVKDIAKNAKRWFIVALVELGIIFGSVITFVLYLNQYDFTSETVAVDSGTGGNANYQTGSGVINNGESDSN